jgi:hypothetical protein
MKSNPLKCAAMAVVTAMAEMAFDTSPVFAHHSFAMFDFGSTVTITTKVEEFRWSNPHVILLAAAMPKEGEAPEVWSFELTSPGNLTRLGWTRLSLKPGDRIQLEFNPLRDGKHGGAFKKATLIDTGQVLTSSVRDANEQTGVK